MKKKVLLIAALFTAGFSFAQDQMTSKKGTPILPEAGEYAIGFDASNLLNYGGNLLNGTSGNSLNNLGDVRANTIYGKYFVDANKAYRGMLQLGFGSTTNKTVVNDLSSGAAAGATVEDEASSSNFGFAVGGGIEMRQGKGRLQGVYGPMVMISIGSSSTENTFGNSLDDQFNDDFPAPVADDETTRTTETSAGSTFGLMLGGFAGVEYFFAPKMSLGAEIQYGINFSSTGNGETVTETRSFDGTNTTTTSTTAETGGSSSFSLGQTPNTMITLNFHF